MQRPPAPSRAAGAAIALALIVGVVVGAALRQPTLGILGGFAVGVAIAGLLWLRDRRG